MMTTPQDGLLAAFLSGGAGGSRRRHKSTAAHRRMRRRGAGFPAQAAVHGGPKRRWSRRRFRTHDSINHYSILGEASYGCQAEFAADLAYLRNRRPASRSRATTPAMRIFSSFRHDRPASFDELRMRANLGGTRKSPHPELVEGRASVRRVSCKSRIRFACFRASTSATPPLSVGRKSESQGSTVAASGSMLHSLTTFQRRASFALVGSFQFEQVKP